eukprot:UN3902
MSRLLYLLHDDFAVQRRHVVGVRGMYSLHVKCEWANSDDCMLLSFPHPSVGCPCWP